MSYNGQSSFYTYPPWIPQNQDLSWGFVSLRPTIFFFPVIKTPGDLQNILDRAFWFFLKADYGTLLYSLYLAFFSFLRFFLFFISLQSNVKCKILEKKQKSKENFSFSVRKVVCLVPFWKGFPHFFVVPYWNHANLLYERLQRTALQT